MPYDKYEHWPLPTRGGNVYPVYSTPGRRIEEQVLEDLAKTDDEVDKLELLDSFAAYYRRAYRKEFAESLAILAGGALGKLLRPFILSQFPEPSPPHRARVAGK